MTTETDALVNFYGGIARDDRGRLLRDIRIWSDDRLERTHDYIQWLFPLAEPSAFNPDAPLVTKETVRAFRSRAELRKKLHTSFVRMLVFYGFTMLEGGGLRVVRTSSFGDRAKVWLSQSNHNHLRITRILKSLRLLGLEEEAEAFFDALEELYEEEEASGRPRITAETMEFWRKARGDRS